MSFQSREWFYSFRELEDLATKQELDKISSRIIKQYAAITKNWNKELNSEWTCRTYFATNMILNATVLLKNAEYAEEKNLRIVKPYIEYYAVLSLLRCVVYTLPSQQWDNGKLIEISHSKAINLASDWLALFNKSEAQELKGFCKLLKAQRELISYRAPASGDANLDNSYDVIKICTILAELAQFNSVLLEASVKKNTDPKDFVVHSDDISKIVNVTIEGIEFYDRYDAIRLDYIRRKGPYPSNLLCTMTEGQTEDYIGAWDNDESFETDDSIYHGGSPCEWQTIFDIP
ncbi:MAG: hypothetical protein MJK15_01790 [Colwellia sp.]|nr:hypothetical protein [Colwellia sp.]